MVESAALLCSMVALLASCGGDGAVGVRTPDPARLVAVAPMEFSGVVGGELSPGPAVRVEDQDGNPLAGIAVVFETPGSHSGIPVLTTVESSSSGIAQLGTLKLGTQAGTQTMTARVQGLSSLAFRAIASAGPAVELVPLYGSNQTGPSGYELQLAVRALDSFGNPVAGVGVVFAVQTGAGSITPPLATTGVHGAVTAVWTLGAVGANSVTASAPSLAEVTFTAVASVPIAPFPARYMLQGMSIVPSEIFLAADGSFTTYVKDIHGSGTYTIEGTKITLKYAPGFWELMASQMDWYRMGPTSPVEEAGTMADRTLTLVRCVSEDCYQVTWIYGRISPTPTASRRSCSRRVKTRRGRLAAPTSHMPIAAASIASTRMARVPHPSSRGAIISGSVNPLGRLMVVASRSRLRPTAIRTTTAIPLLEYSNLAPPAYD